MDSSSVVKIGLVGAAGYLAYRYFLAPAATTPTTSTTPVTPASPATVPQPLDQIYTKMLAAAAAEGVGSDGAGLDAWNVYLIRGGGPSPAPAPEDVFGAMSADDRTRKYTGAEYWAKMAPYLKAKGGFVGLGLFGYLATGRYA